ncbi:MAG: hypothetical protein RRY95_08120 [Oscillospiraceae bacterium]
MKKRESVGTALGAVAIAVSLVAAVGGATVAIAMPLAVLLGL